MISFLGLFTAPISNPLQALLKIAVSNYSTMFLEKKDGSEVERDFLDPTSGEEDVDGGSGAESEGVGGEEEEGEEEEEVNSDEDVGEVVVAVEGTDVGGKESVKRRLEF